MMGLSDFCQIIPHESTNKDQFTSVAQSCPTLCDPMDCSTPGFSVHHQLLKLTQTHVGDAIQPSHPLSSPSPPAFNLSHTRLSDFTFTFREEMLGVRSGRNGGGNQILSLF